jgi:hypothetical protein
MRHWRIWLYLVGVIGIIGFCMVSSLPYGFKVSRSNNQPQAATQNKAVSTRPAVTEAAVTPAAAEAAVNVPAEDSSPTVAAPAEQVNYCVECHTDKAQLIDTAAPVEEVIKESEGSG